MSDPVVTLVVEPSSFQTMSDEQTFSVPIGYHRTTVYVVQETPEGKSIIIPVIVRGSEYQYGLLTLTVTR